MVKSSDQKSTSNGLGDIHEDMTSDDEAKYRSKLSHIATLDHDINAKIIYIQIQSIDITKKSAAIDCHFFMKPSEVIWLLHCLYSILKQLQFLTLNSLPSLKASMAGWSENLAIACGKLNGKIIKVTEKLFSPWCSIAGCQWFDVMVLHCHGCSFIW